MNLSQNAGGVMLTAEDALFNAGTLQFYVGGALPATPETAVTGTLSDTFTFANPAFAAPTYSSPNEQAVGSIPTATVTPTVGGVCSYARAFQSNGTTVIGDYTVGTSGTDIIVGNATFQTGVPVTITSFLNKMPAV